MIWHVVTLFPEEMDKFLSIGVLGRAREKNLVKVNLVNPRDFTEDRHRTVDDVPYGGGAGMVLKPEPLFKTVRSIREAAGAQIPVWLTSPHGRLLTDSLARELALTPEQVIICGHYGGVDERVREALSDGEISIGDYVLTGGETAAAAIIDAAARFVRGVVGNEDSVALDTFSDGLLGPPQYTRPPVFEGMQVPEALTSGHHANIQDWRRRMKLKATFENRPDLLGKAELSPKDIKFLESLGYRKET